MATLYTPKQAAQKLGVSISSLRIYTEKYARHLSTEATGTPRRLTPDDLKALVYVVQRTGQGRTHDQILAAWEADYPSFAWEDEDADEPETAEPTALVPVAQLKAAQALMLDAQRREELARQEAQAERERARQVERELQEKVEQLLRELGKSEGELAAVRAQMERSAKDTRSWWARLFGAAGE